MVFQTADHWLPHDLTGKPLSGDLFEIELFQRYIWNVSLHGFTDSINARVIDTAVAAEEGEPR